MAEIYEDEIEDWSEEQQEQQRRGVKRGASSGSAFSCDYPVLRPSHLNQHHSWLAGAAPSGHPLSGVLTLRSTFVCSCELCEKCIQHSISRVALLAGTKHPHRSSPIAAAAAIGASASCGDGGQEVAVRGL